MGRRWTYKVCGLICNLSWQWLRTNGSACSTHHSPFAVSAAPCCRALMVLAWPLQGGYFETRNMLKRGEGRWEGCPDLFGDSPAAEIFP